MQMVEGGVGLVLFVPTVETFCENLAHLCYHIGARGSKAMLLNFSTATSDDFLK